MGLLDANELINTRLPAPLQRQMLRESVRSWDYYHSGPYPAHAFGPQQWPADKGPAPTPLPYAQILINEGAEFVFRNGVPTFSVADNEPAEDLLKRIIAGNELDAQWIAMAQQVGNQGAIAVKFSVDAENAACPVRIDFLDVPQECRIWVDPVDSKKILMARIQFPYQGAGGDWFYFREEWTADRHVTYQPKPAGDAKCQTWAELPQWSETLGDGDDWQVALDEDNPLGLIPIRIIRNRRVKGNALGVGDCWNILRLIDRIALTMQGEDQSNQLHSNPTVVTTNAAVENKAPLLAGEPLDVKNVPGLPPADVKMLEPSGAAREYSHKDIDKWEELLYKAVGLSRVNPAEVTNKGNMTELAFRMTYGRTISTSDQKRLLWGPSGMALFFADILLALKRLGGVNEARDVPEDVIVSCAWPSYFDVTPEDISTLTESTTKQVEAGLNTRERGAEEVAKAKKLPPKEIEKLKAELKAIAAASAAPVVSAEGAASSDSAGNEGGGVSTMTDAE